MSAQPPTRQACRLPSDAVAKSADGLESRHPIPDSKTKEHNCFACAQRRSAIVLPRSYAKGGLADRLATFEALGSLAHSLCAQLVAPPPCKLFMPQVTGGKPARCNASWPTQAPWSAYLALSYAQPPYGPLPTSERRWYVKRSELAAAGFRLIATPANRSTAHNIVHTDDEAAAEAAALGAPFVWYIALPLHRWANVFRNSVQNSLLARGCPAPAVSHSPHARAGAPRPCHFVRGRRSHSKLATTLRDRFARDHLLREHFYDYVHIRRLRNGCNDTTVENVTAHVGRHLGLSNLPLVLSSSFRQGSYLDALKEALAPRQVILPAGPLTAILRQQAAAACAPESSCAAHPVDNYLLYAAERALAAGARKAFHIGYLPCGRVRLGWEGVPRAASRQVG